MYLFLNFSLSLLMIMFIFKALYTNVLRCGQTPAESMPTDTPYYSYRTHSHAMLCVTVTAVFVRPLSLIHSDSWNTAVYTKTHTECVPADTLSTHIFAITHTQTERHTKIHTLNTQTASCRNHM